MENLIKMDDLGVPLFSETSICGPGDSAAVTFLSPSWRSPTSFECGSRELTIPQKGHKVSWRGCFVRKKFEKESYGF